MILEADAVDNAESNSALNTIVRLMHSSGVCVVGMHENTQPRNLGDPAHSPLGKHNQSCLQDDADGEQEVRWLHSTEEAE